MTDQQNESARLRDEAAAKLAHADALEAWGRQRKVVPCDPLGDPEFGRTHGAHIANAAAARRREK